MSEAELHVLKQRMQAGKRAKAERGELGMRLPMGYVQAAFGRGHQGYGWRVQATIQLIF